MKTLKIFAICLASISTFLLTLSLAIAATGDNLNYERDRDIEPEPIDIRVESEIMKFLNSADKRSLEVFGDELNRQGKIADYIELSNGDLLITSFELAQFSDQYSIQIIYSPSRISGLQTSEIGGGLRDIGKDMRAASVINRLVKAQTFCQFSNYPGHGFVAAGEVMAQINGELQQISVEMAVLPANMGAQLKLGIHVAVPSEDCKWTNPENRTGCKVVNCKGHIGTKWIGIDVTGTCRASTLLWPFDDVKRCDCAI